MFLKATIIVSFLLFLNSIICPPVDPKKEEKSAKNETAADLDDFGLEYGRYLQQVVQALEEDKEFAKKLENISAEQIKSGHIAKELEFVKHNVRSKLDELKRIEVDRLRKLIQAQLDKTDLGVYGDGHLGMPDGRRWRTVPNRVIEGLNRKGIKIPSHLDIQNPHSFEIDDLKKLIQTATNDLEELDKKRREEFKKYEMEKEATYRESLQNITSDEKKEKEKHHQEMIDKHKDHPKIHHPGSKPQLEQVWEEQDHMPKEEFNPRTFFAMHDVNGDGFLDVEEVEAILIPEVKKMYNPNNEEDDPQEMWEEFHRMREHIFNETDKNKDALISHEEFMKMTERQDFQQDDGWKGLDEQQVYSEAEMEEYMRERQMHHGDPLYYNVGPGNHQGVPPQINYQGMPPHQPGGYPGQDYYQQVPQHGQFQQGHPEQYQQGHPQQIQGQQQFQQGHPQQFQQGHPQQFQQGHPQQFQQAQPQQFQQGHPQVPPQQFQQGHPQQVPPPQFQQIPPQQLQQAPPQQFQQGQPQPGQHQQFQGSPPQFQQGQPQQFPQPPQQQPQVNKVQSPNSEVPQPNVVHSNPSDSANKVINNVPGDIKQGDIQQPIPK